MLRQHGATAVASFGNADIARSAFRDNRSVQHQLANLLGTVL
jgi:hypothetical protein